MPFDNETLAFKSILDRDNGKPTFDNDKPTINKWQMDIGQEKTTQRKWKTDIGQRNTNIGHRKTDIEHWKNNIGQLTTKINWQCNPTFDYGKTRRCRPR